MKINEAEYRRLEREVTRLLKALKADIGDEYRASDDDTLPSMQVTIGATADVDGGLRWSYQTGDNSYSGGAYGHPFWGVISLSLYRRSNCRQLAREAVSQIADCMVD